MELKDVDRKLKQLHNLQKAIVRIAKHTNEKVIAVNSETYEDVYGKEITLKFSTEVLKEMEKELED